MTGSAVFRNGENSSVAGVCLLLPICTVFGFVNNFCCPPGLRPSCFRPWVSRSGGGGEDCSQVLEGGGLALLLSGSGHLLRPIPSPFLLPGYPRADETEHNRNEAAEDGPDMHKLRKAWGTGSRPCSWGSNKCFRHWPRLKIKTKAGFFDNIKN